MMAKMRIIARNTLTAYAASLVGNKDQPAVKAALDAWYQMVGEATWANSMALKAQFGSASIVGARAVFNIKGNDYRLVVDVDYQRETVFIKWIGTHAEYDRIDVRTVQYGD